MCRNPKLMISTGPHLYIFSFESTTVKFTGQDQHEVINVRNPEIHEMYSTPAIKCSESSYAVLGFSGIFKFDLNSLELTFEKKFY